MSESVNKLIPPSLRVFISSTFKDMFSERNLLIKEVFPELRRKCEERGVSFFEVDLRWGITKENQAEGQVLPICLSEIDNCRPFFICILGERYGWVPENLDTKWLMQHDWLKDANGKSITELEILYGVLKDPEMQSRAFFYFRDKGYVDSLPEGMRNDYIETPSEDEIQKYGRDQAVKRCEQRKQQLLELKERIRKSSCRVRENFKSPEELARLVFEDLTCIVDELYPESTDKEKIKQDWYVREFTRVYYPQNNYIKLLNDYINSNNPPLVLYGESGSGKSALLANWSLDMQEKGHNIIHIFCGASESIRYWGELTRQIVNKVRDIDENIPFPDFKPGASMMFSLMAKLGEKKTRNQFVFLTDEEVEQWQEAFKQWMKALPEDRKFILIIDGLDELEDYDNAKYLSWLPSEELNNIRMIVSVNDTSMVEILRYRNWTFAEMDGLCEEEINSYVDSYLERYSKRLDERQYGIICSTNNPLPLHMKILIDELRFTGSFETIDTLIEGFAKCHDTDELYGLIFNRILERLGEDARAGYIRVLCAAALCRKGLTEHDILNILEGYSTNSPRSIWSAIRLESGMFFDIQPGLVRISNKYAKNFIKEQLIQGEEKEYHKILVRVFENRLSNLKKEIKNIAILDAIWQETIILKELLWHCEHAYDWDKLYSLLSDWSIIDKLIKLDMDTVRRCWMRLKFNTDFSMLSTYESYFSKDLSFEGYRVLTLMADLCEENEAKEKALFYGIENLSASLNNPSMEMDDNVRAKFSKAVDIYMNGDIEKAVVIMEDCLVNESIKERTKCSMYDLLGSMYGKMGNFDKQLNAYENELKYAQISGQLDVYGNALMQKGRSLYNLHQSREALKYVKKAEEIFEYIGDMMQLASIYQSEGMIRKSLGEFEEALILYGKERFIWQKSGYFMGLMTSMLNEGNIYILMDQYQKSIDIFQSAYDMNQKTFKGLSGKSATEYHQHKELEAKLLGNIGYSYLSLKEFKKAEDKLISAYAISKEIGLDFALSNTLDRLIKLYVYTNNRNEALKYILERQQIMMKAGNVAELLKNIRDEIQMLQQMNMPEKSLRRRKFWEQFFEKAGKTDMIKNLFEEMDKAPFSDSDYRNKLDELKREEYVLSHLDKKDDLFSVIKKQLLLYLQAKETDEARKSLRRLSALACETENDNNILDAMSLSIHYLTLENDPYISEELLQGPIMKHSSFIEKENEKLYEIYKRILELISERMSGNKAEAVQFGNELLDDVLRLNDKELTKHLLHTIKKQFIYLECIDMVGLYYKEAMKLMYKLNGDNKEDGKPISYQDADVEEYISRLEQDYVNSFRVKDWHKCADILSKEKDLTIIIGDERRHSAIIGNIAINCRKLGKFEEALVLHDEAIRFMKAQGMERDELIELLGKSITLDESGRQEEAISLLDDMINLAEERNMPDMRAAALANQTSYLRNAGITEGLKEKIRQTAEIYKQLGMYKDYAIELFNLSTYLFDHEPLNCDEINDHIAEIKKIASEHGLTDVFSEVLKLEQLMKGNTEPVGIDKAIDTIIERFKMCDWDTQPEPVTFMGYPAVKFTLPFEDVKIINEQGFLLCTPSEDDPEQLIMSCNIVCQFTLFSKDNDSKVQDIVKILDNESRRIGYMYDSNNHRVIARFTYKTVYSRISELFDELVFGLLNEWERRRVLLPGAVLGLFDNDTVYKILEDERNKKDSKEQ